jgi:signal transduction histidine kinase
VADKRRIGYALEGALNETLAADPGRDRGHGGHRSHTRRAFEDRGAASAGHFGLRLMTDAATHGGGELALLSAPGAGTRIRYRAGAE